MAKLLRDKGIPLPQDDSLKAYEHRLLNWQQGNGYLVRRLKLRNLKERKPLPIDMEVNKVFWLPNSNFARSILETGLVALLGRKPYIPKGATLLDIPILNGEGE